MKKLLLTLLLALCISASSFADGKLPKLLIDGCFFNEMPSDVDGKQVGVIILSDHDGNKIMAIKGVKLSDESKRYAVKKEDVPNADYWIEQAQVRESMAMKMVYNVPKKTRIAEGDTIGQFSVKDVDGRVWDNASTKGRALVLKLVTGTNGQKRHDMLEAIKKVSAVR